MVAASNHLPRRTEIVVRFHAQPGVIRQMDGPLLHMVDYAPEDMHGDGWRRIVPKDQRDTVALIIAHLQRGMGGIFHQSVAARNGDRAFLRVCLRPVATGTVGHSMLMHYHPARRRIQLCPTIGGRPHD